MPGYPVLPPLFPSRRRFLQASAGFAGLSRLGDSTPAAPLIEDSKIECCPVFSLLFQQSGQTSVRNQEVILYDDADFELRAIRGLNQSVNGFLRFSDADGFYLSNIPIPAIFIFVSDPSAPYSLYPGLQVPAGGKIGIEFTSTATTPNLPVQIVFRGIRTYRKGPRPIDTSSTVKLMPFWYAFPLPILAPGAQTLSFPLQTDYDAAFTAYSAVMFNFQYSYRLQLASQEYTAQGFSPFQTIEATFQNQPRRFSVPFEIPAGGQMGIDLLNPTALTPNVPPYIVLFGTKKYYLAGGSQ